jgi:hypothetical protein
VDKLYSLSLLVSLGSGSAAFLIGLLALLTSHLESRPVFLATDAKIRRFAFPAIYLAFVALLISVVVHVFSGHSPGSTESLGLPGFIRAHPSFLLAASLPLTAGILLRFTSENPDT